jgi:hypothetical protein
LLIRLPVDCRELNNAFDGYASDLLLRRGLLRRAIGSKVWMRKSRLRAWKEIHLLATSERLYAWREE